MSGTFISSLGIGTAPGDVSITCQPSTSAEQILRTLRSSVLVAISYYLGTRVGFALTPSGQPNSTFWPPNAILLAAFLLVPRRIWWTFLLAVLPAHIFAELQAGVPVWTALGWFITNTSEALIGAFCITRFTDAKTMLYRVRGVFIFVVLGVLFAPLATSFLDAATVVITGWGRGLWPIGTERFWTNALAELTVVPPVLICGSNGISWFRKASIARYCEATLLAVATVLVTVLVFGFHYVSPITTPALLYVPLPLLLWAAVRFGPGGLSLSVLCVALISTSFAMQGRVPFPYTSMPQNVLSVQILLCFVVVPLLFLSAVMFEREQTEEKLRVSEERLRLAQQAARVGTFEWNIRSGVNTWTPELEAVYGLPPGGFAGTQTAFENLVHPDDRARVIELDDWALKTGQPTKGEWRVIWADGSVHWIAGRWQVFMDESGEPLRMVGVNLDVTEHKLAEEALSQASRRVIEAEEQERTRIARELHDNINQRLALLSVETDVSKRNPPSSAADMSRLLTELRERIVEISSEVQSISHQLHSSQLEYLGIAAAVKGFCHEFAAGQKVEIDFTQDEIPKSVPPEVSLCLFRVLQEALHNAIKHSHVRHFAVSLGYSANQLHLTVSDRGTGFDVERATNKGGLGLTSMRERVRLVNGTIAIDSKPMGGATIHVRVPLESEHAS